MIICFQPHEHPPSCYESFVAFFGCVTCTVTRAGDGQWRWETKGHIYRESGIARTKRWAMSEALKPVTKIQKMKFKPLHKIA